MEERKRFTRGAEQLAPIQYILSTDAKSPDGNNERHHQVGSGQNDHGSIEMPNDLLNVHLDMKDSRRS